MPARFLVVPQWQGSGSSRAMRLADGANAIAGDLPAAATTPVEVRVEAGDSLGTGVRRYSSIQATAEQVHAALETFDDGETVFLIGGDCGADVAAAARAASRHDDLLLVWFDAHGDLHTPESSPSGTFSGMVLRALLGDGAEGLAVSPAAFAPERVLHAGARALDEAEVAYLESSGIRALTVDELATAEALVEAAAATGAARVYIHVDLDVLDPAIIEGVGYPEPFGLEVEHLTAAIMALRSRFELVGGAVTGFAPASPDAAASDLSAILRVLSALTRPLAPADAR
ncbi:MAG: arginase family protein [Microbacteriaceae bacterium]|nr:arginase family protein [Microbacteriaceae bacterium]MCL2794649.1 arginase family protein [Microbacteriaceae bacterium]